MDVLIARRALLAAVAVVAGCGPKPLRVTHEGADAAADVLATDASSADLPPADAARVGDGGVGDGGVAPGASCAEDPAREDCARVRVAASSPFCVGEPGSAANALWNASPPLCGLSLSPFEVDAREVTVARFRVFHARWIAGRLPAWEQARFANGVSMRAPLPPPSAPAEWSPNVVGCTWSDAADGPRERHPINCVGWALAMYFCAWEGGHLVTSAQHEYLARWRGAAGASGRTFPWGEAAPSCDLAHYGPCPGDDGVDTRRAGALAAGAASGVFDLSGNVAELVADDFAPYATLAASPCWTRSPADPLCQPTLGGAHFARGGSHQNDSEVLLRAVFRPSTGSGDASPARGFRCAYPAR